MRALLVLALIGAVALLVGCSVDSDSPLARSGGPHADVERIPGWTAIDIRLYPGRKALAYDGDRDLLWIAHWPFDTGLQPEDVIILTSLDLQTGGTRDYEVPDSTHLMAVGSGLVAARDGTVWLAVGRRLVQLNPSIAKQREWDVPVADFGLRAQEEGLDGNVVAMTMLSDSTLLVANYGDRAVHRFNMASEIWDSIDVGVVTWHRSLLAGSSSGDLLVTGVQFAPDGRAYDIAVKLGPDGRGGFSVENTVASPVAVFSATGDLIGLGPGQSTTLIERATGRPTLLPSRPAEDSVKRIVAEGPGGIWVLAQGPQSGYEFDVVDLSSGATRVVPFPTGTINCKTFRPNFGLGACEDGAVIFAGVSFQGAVFDKRGDLWVATEGTSGGIPPYLTVNNALYRYVDRP